MLAEGTVTSRTTVFVESCPIAAYTATTAPAPTAIAARKAPKRMRVRRIGFNGSSGF